MSRVTAVLSMLHEDADVHSATRQFRQSPVLRWTLDRIQRSGLVNEIAVVCWQDQLDAVRLVADDADAHVLAKGPRVAVSELDAISAARRWGDGWRGGLHGATEFDQGFYAPWIAELADRLPSDLLLLVNPASALIDAGLLDDLINRAIERDDVEFCFLPAAPGFAAATLRPDLLKRLAGARQHPGRTLCYQPDHPIRDAIGSEAAVDVPTPVARTVRRFNLDSDRQIEQMSAATISLNGSLMGSGAEQILYTVQGTSGDVRMPREITLELNTQRLSKPIDSPSTHLSINRPAMSVDAIRSLMKEIGRVDDLRLTLAGVGDPLLCDSLFETIALAQAEGVKAINLETDLLVTDESIIRRLVETKIDVVSVITPAATPATYEKIMGVDGLERSIHNLQIFLDHRRRLERGVPLIAPVFIKTAANLGELEAWHDHWLRAVGSAVVRGPSDYAGQIADHAVADMSPPIRRPCARLAARMTILCDGTIVACEQDVLGKQPLGKVGVDSIADVWQSRFAGLRADHKNACFTSHPLCGRCREWHRP